MATIHISFTNDGVEYLIGMLRKLPHEDVHDLVMAIWDQYQRQYQPPPAAQPELPLEQPAGGSTDEPA